MARAKAKKKKKAKRNKVLLIGWDGADWKVIHPLMDEGRMPALKIMVEQGTIANLATLRPVLSPMLWTSIATGMRPFKHGVLGFTKSLAGEVALSGYPEITVNAVCPFFVETEMFRGPHGYLAQMSKMAGLSENEIQDKVVGRSLQKRVLDPDEVAAMALYLASDDARGVTGQAFNICGGRVFH